MTYQRAIRVQQSSNPFTDLGRQYAILIAFSLFLGATACGQVQTQAITNLKGTQTKALITIGDQGLAQGMRAPYSVNTIAYPDGQVIYRIEWGIIRGEVAQMVKRFDTGTPLEITEVDLKDDRLEVKLHGRNGDSGR